MLRFGLPTVPADASVYALQVADRFYLFRAYSHTAAGLYAVAIKLATVVFVAVRGFQYAWPPLAYSIESDEEAGAAVLARHDLLRARHRASSSAAWRCSARWMVRLLAAPQLLRRLPRAALAGARLGAVRPVPRVRRDRRPRAGDRAQPARRALAGLAVNVALLLLLVPAAGAGLGIAGAGIALCGAYVAMLVVMYVLTREPLQGRLRMAAPGPARGVLAAVAVSGELLLPTAGLAGLVARVAWLGARARAAAADALLPPPRAAPRRGRCWPTAAGGWPASAPATARSRPTPRTRCGTCRRRGAAAALGSGLG